MERNKDMSVNATRGWVKIKHPHRPLEADYEADRLRKRLEEFPDAVVETLTTWALMQPEHGSFAGALWAIAEWAAQQKPTPDVVG